MPTTMREPVGERDLRVGPVPGAPATSAQCFVHAQLSPEEVLGLVKAHSRNYRAVDALTAWSGHLPAGDDGDPDLPGYPVLGWTSTSVLRATLSARVDALNPVAAFRLLDQPELAQLECSNRDYVVLLGPEGAPGGRPVPGAISARDIDLWCTADPAEFDGAFAVDGQTYWHRFAGTGVAT